MFAIFLTIKRSDHGLFRKYYVNTVANVEDSYTLSRQLETVRDVSPSDPINVASTI